MQHRNGPFVVPWGAIVVGLVSIFAIGRPVLASEPARNDAAELSRWNRVRVKMDARGELFAPVGQDGSEIRKPFTSTARFDFLEASIPAGTDDAGAGDAAPAIPHAAVGVRHFFAAVSELSIDGGVIRRSLRPDMTTLAVTSRPTVGHFSTDGPLTQEEAELLAVAFDPWLLDRLPTEPGPPEWIAALLAIDTIGRPADEGPSSDASPSGLRFERESPDEERAAKRIRLQGAVDGAVDGVPTTIEIEGTLEIEPQEGHEPHVEKIRGGYVTLRERRLAGPVSPGFVCEASIQFARRPADVSADPPVDGEARNAVESTWKRVVTGETRGGPGRVAHLDPAGRFTLEHDIRWRHVSDDARGLVLRLIDDGALLAECTVRALPPSAPGTTLRSFEEDISTALGAAGARRASSEEKTGEDGCRHLRVVSEGAEGEVPLEWRHHLIEDSRGRRLTVTFVIERRFIGRFGGADAELIAGAAFSRGAAP